MPPALFKTTHLPDLFDPLPVPLRQALLWRPFFPDEEFEAQKGFCPGLAAGKGA